jgi:hypothetical protein
VVVSEGVTHMVLDQFPQASSTEMKRDVHDGGHKFIDGRHGTSPGWRPIPPFFSGELLPAFFFYSVVRALITCLECKWEQ